MFGIEKVYHSWSFERISRHVLYWSFWVLLYTTVNGTHNDDYVTWFLLELHLTPVKWVVTYTVIYLFVPRLLVRKKYLAFVVATAILATLGGIALRSIEYFHLADLFNLDYLRGQFWNFKTFYKVLDLVYIASLPTIIKLLQRNLQQERTNTQLATGRINAELQLLKNQLQPHFLFNTLNNLYGMILTQSERAPEVVLGLSNLLSYMLYECQVDWVPLAKEVEQIERYLALERIRYDERLRIDFTKGSDLEGHTIAPMLLFPFVENAIKHSAAASEMPCWVQGSVETSENGIEFVLENSMPIAGILNNDELHSGIGLQNVSKRLELLYPDSYTLSINNDKTFRVVLQIKATQ